MARLIILIAVIATALILWYKIKTAKPEERKRLVFWSILGAVGLVLLLLAMTGHLNVITAAIAGLFALVPRLLQYARYLPILKQFFDKNNPTAQNGEQGRPNNGNSSSDMSVEQAYEILGLKPGCSKEDIILAHKRMMQKVHPDRGGSDFLAAQLNEAKRKLLR